MDWNSIKDELPAIGTEVIAFVPDGVRGAKVTALCRFVRYDGDAGYYWDNSYGGGNTHIQDSVTHWMPLPNPPTPLLKGE